MSNIPIKPKDVMFTDQQWQAIYETDHDLLVSASAGSGKTRILVQRVIEKIRAGQAVDQLLIVTFTEAAAREMKQRIDTELRVLLENTTGKERQWLLHQLHLLPTAPISTLHAFCLRVIRRYYYAIDLDPDFRLLTDDTERLLLQEEVMERVLEAAYEEKSPAFYAFVSNFMSDRSDQQLAELLLKLYEFSRANPKPDVWLDQLAMAYETPASLVELPLYQEVIKPDIKEKLEEAIVQLTYAFDQAEGLVKIRELLMTEKEQAATILAALELDELATVQASLQQVSFKTYRVGKGEDKEIAAQLKPLRLHARNLVETAASLLPYSIDQTKEVLTHAQPIVTQAVALTKEFTTQYQAYKRQKKVLDFNDLEHLTLAILAVKNEEIDVQTFYRELFKEVLVDEYQDINRLQQAILEAVATQDPGNLFMVGDVKQSIYAFRLADPTLFIDKYTRYKAHQAGEKIDLKENFRSRKEVLEFTNLIFEQLMDHRVGQIDYENEALLVPGAKGYPETSDHPLQPEILIYESETTTQSERLATKKEGEIHMVAQKIKELMENQYELFDRKHNRMRPISYQDIVLLTPTRTSHLTILDVFQEYQLPVAINDAPNYFQTTEIQVMLSLLQIIDNPIQDIPLVSVLRSPIVGLNEAELADIRLENKDVTFYQALVQYPKEHVLLKRKLTRFLTQLDAWRTLAKRQPIATLLQTIYDETAYPDYVLGMASGQQRYANLMALIHRAQRYEESSFRGLYPFVRFIEKMREKNKDLAQPVAKTQAESIQVMTIHASKGLEFPVVFVLDMAKQANTQELNNTYLMDEQLGLGIKVVDEERIEYASLPYLAMRQQKLVKALSEEMRKLYVALTRAEQKLFLVAAYKNQADVIKQASKALDQEAQFLNPQLRLSSQSSLMDWVLLTLARHPLFEQYLDDPMQRRKIIAHPAVFSLQFYNPDQLETGWEYWQAQTTVTQNAIVTTDEFGALPKVLLDRLTYRYPHPKATKTASYQSVSEIKRLYNDPDEQDMQLLDWQNPNESGYRQVEQLAKPKFLAAKEVRATLVGQAMHYLMQQLPLDVAPTRASLKEQVALLEASGRFPELAREQLDLEAILWFFDTDLGQELLAHPLQVAREQPFSMLKPAMEIYREFDDQEAELLIHGIIDGYIEYSDHIVLYDFKTDHLGKQTKAQILERYRGQLRLYQQALEQALHKPVRATYLVLLSGRDVVSL